MSAAALCLLAATAWGRCADLPGETTAEWPGDIVRRMDDALLRQPDDPQQTRLRAERDGAARALQALQQREVRLQRSAFCAADADGIAADELRRAARGDGDAALRIAHRYRGREAAQDQHRYEGWLQFASALGHDGASYELSRLYRASGQPVFAAIYEAKAVARGLVLPVSLDHVRK